MHLILNIIYCLTTLLPIELDWPCNLGLTESHSRFHIKHQKQDSLIVLLNGIQGGKGVEMYYIDRFNDNSKFIKISSAHPVAEINSGDPVFLLYGMENIYLLHPGDTVSIESGRDSKPVFSSKNPSIQAYLTIQQVFSKRFGPTFFYDSAYAQYLNAGSRNKSDMVQFIKSRLGNQIAFFDSLCRIINLAPEFQQEYNAHLNYVSLYRLAVIENAFAAKKEKIQESVILEMAGHLQRDSLVYLEAYRYFAASVFKLLSQLYPKEDTISLITKRFSGETKNFLLLNMVRQISNKRRLTLSELERYLAAFTPSAYRDYFSENFYQDKELAGANDPLLAFSGTKNTLNMKELLNLHKGKLIYIEFWASWCAPCREKIPYTQKLMEEFKNNPIAIVLISTDAIKTNWQRAVREEQITGIKNNFLLLQAKTSAFIQQQKISEIPRYLLFGKDGKLLLANAPGPDDEKLKRLLKQLLNK